MRRPPPRIYVAVGAVVAAALLAVGLAVVLAAPRMSTTRWVLLAETGFAFGAARFFPVRMAHRANQLVTTTALFLATLLLPAAVAMSAAAVLTVVTDRRRRVRWFQTSFNAGQYVLLVGAGSVAFAAVAGQPMLSGAFTSRTLAAVCLAALAMDAANLLLVHGMVSVQAGRWRPAGLWRLLRVDLPQQGSLFLLGVLGAMIAGWSAWLVALPLAATAIIYRELTAAARRPLVDLVAESDVQAIGSTPLLALLPAKFWTGTL